MHSGDPEHCLNEGGENVPHSFDSIMVAVFNMVLVLVLVLVFDDQATLMVSKRY